MFNIKIGEHKGFVFFNIINFLSNKELPLHFNEVEKIMITTV